jgi:hypothetical protein
MAYVRLMLGLGASVGLANPGYVFDVRVDEG